jgi:hypothetical protein
MPVVLAAFLSVGCGETVIDDVKAEDAIESDLERSHREKIATVDCPAGEAVETGKTFTCVVKFSDGRQEIAILKIRNQDADVSFVGLEPTQPERGE